MGKAVRGMDEDRLIPQGAHTGEDAQAGQGESIEAAQADAEEEARRESAAEPQPADRQDPLEAAPDEQTLQAPGTVSEEDQEAPPGPQDYMSDWGRRANALSEKAWRICQILMGAVMGLACAACLLFFQSDGFLPVNFIVAFLLAKFGPDFVEKWFERKAPVSRGALLIALAAALAVYIVYGLLTNRFG